MCLPEIQILSGLSYTHTKELVQHAVQRGWLSPSPTNPDTYQVKSREFTLRHVLQKEMKNLAENITYDCRKVLEYLNKHQRANLSMILAEVDPDREDMRAALDTLTKKALIILVGCWYYINISPTDLDRLIQEVDKKKNEMADRFRSLHGF